MIHYMHPPTNASSLPFAFQPITTSPLSPRSPNIHGRYSMSSEGKKLSRDKSPQSITSAQRFAQRSVKTAPTCEKGNAVKLGERRRNTFLRKVKDRGEERRWESRGEDIMRLDFMQRQRQWEAEQARLATHLSSSTLDEENEEDDDYDLPMSSGPVQMPEDEVDDVMRKEDEELEALLENLPDQDNEATRSSGEFWSDDVDYDALFSEMMERDQHAQRDSNATQEQGDAMDMT